MLPIIKRFMLACFTTGAATLAASAAEPLPLVDPSAGVEALSAQLNQATLAAVAAEQGRQALEMTVGEQGGDYPGIQIPAPNGAWDLSAYRAIEASLTNTGSAAARVHLRVDNSGDWKKSPWSINAVNLKPGETKTLRVEFGRSYGNPGFALDPAKVIRVLVFTEKPKQAVTIRINGLQAAGEATSTAATAPAPAPGPAGEAPNGPLLDAATADLDQQLKGSSDQVTFASSTDTSAPGVVVTIAPGEDGYPGVTVTPKSGKPWDLSAFGHIEAHITNTSEKSLSVSLRADNPGDWKKSPWNTESTTIKPGATGMVKVIFGYSYGFKKAYPLDPSKVTQLVIFTGKVKAEQSFRIDSIVAAGPAGEKPPVDPKSVRVKPANGVILGEGVTVDPGTQLTATGVTAEATTSGDRPALRVTFPAGKGEQKAVFRPAVGRWDLRDYLEVRVTVRNAGQSPVTPRLRLESNGGSSDTVVADAALAPGQEREFVIPFAAATSWRGPKTSTEKSSHGEGGAKLTNDAVSAVSIMAQSADAKRELLVTSIVAGVPELVLPDWLGKRPPVEGDWVQTFADDFDSGEIDASRWNIYGENYWDKKSHFSKDNVILGDGVVRLRFEKKHGHQNDDPNHKRVTDYAVGYLDTYGKWTQTYGYFEARMKLPTAPGLWPAFWMMPDRGVEAGEQWRRADTGKGGMEFDIMEHLTRWGPHRYNIAMHWDGYDKNHKVTGSEKIYVQPDKDGYIVSGLLWEPGLAVFYCNGKEIARWENERISNVQSDLMFTLPMGGWDNSPLDDARLPDDFIIDYVRCWQRRERVQ